MVLTQNIGESKMTVSELIAELQKQPQDAEVLIDCRRVDIDVDTMTDFYADGSPVVCLTT